MHYKQLYFNELRLLLLPLCALNNTFHINSGYTVYCHCILKNIFLMIDLINYSPDKLRAVNADTLKNMFDVLYAEYNTNKNNLTDDKRMAYKEAFRNLVDRLSSQAKWDSTANRYRGSVVSKECNGDCSFLTEAHGKLQRLSDKASENINPMETITQNKTTIETNKSILLSRQAQYDMAIKRNRHRRDMIVTVAGLNTLLLGLYYLLIKDPPAIIES